MEAGVLEREKEREIIPVQYGKLTILFTQLSCDQHIFSLLNVLSVDTYLTSHAVKRIVLLKDTEHPGL